MFRQTWKVHRQLSQKPDALYRWDQFYQCLLQITLSQQSFLAQNEVGLSQATQAGQEVSNEPSTLSESFYFSANSHPDN